MELRSNEKSVIDYYLKYIFNFLAFVINKEDIVINLYISVMKAKD